MRSVDWPGRWLQDRLGYEPRDLALLRAALTHRSAAGPNNERLEFLGDAVLNLIIAHHLYAAFPQAAEGDLSRLRARLVSREPLAEVALTLGLGETLQLGAGELRSGGFRRQSILADALEAVCGALFLDGGLAAVERVIARLFAPPQRRNSAAATLRWWDGRTSASRRFSMRSSGTSSASSRRVRRPPATAFWACSACPRRRSRSWTRRGSTPTRAAHSTRR